MKKNPQFKATSKEISDIVKENGLGPRRLVFRIVPRLPKIDTNLSVRQEIVEAVAESRMEMNVIIAEQKVSKASNKKIPQYAGQMFRIGNCLLNCL